MNKKRIALTLLMAFLSEIANKVVPLVNLHLVANRLGVEAFGLAQYAMWLLEWGIVLTTFGFPQLAPVMLRDAISPADQRRVNGSIILARSILAVVALFALMSALHLNQQLSVYQPAVLSSLFILAASALDSSWILAAKQKLAILSLTSMIAKLSSVLAIFLMIHSPDDAITFVVITNGVNAVIAIVSFIIANRLVGFTRPSLHEIKCALQAASPFALAIFLLAILERFDLFLVENYFGTTATGLYSAASKLVGSITPIIAAISGVFYSEMLAHHDKETLERLIKASLFWVLSVVAPVAFMINFFDKEVLSLVFGPAYAGAASVLSTLSIGAFFFSAVIVFGFQLLALKRQWLPLVAGLALGALFGIGAGALAVESKNLAGVSAAAIVAKLVAGLVVTFAAMLSFKLRTRVILTAIYWPVLPTFLTMLAAFVVLKLGIISPAFPVFLAFLIIVHGAIFCLLNITEARWVLNRTLGKMGIADRSK